MLEKEKCGQCEAVTVINERTIEEERVRLYQDDNGNNMAAIICWKCENSYEVIRSCIPVFECSACESRLFDLPDEKRITTKRIRGDIVTMVSCDCGLDYTIPTSDKRRIQAEIEAASVNHNSRHLRDYDKDAIG